MFHQLYATFTQLSTRVLDHFPDSGNRLYLAIIITRKHYFDCCASFSPGRRLDNTVGK